MIIGKINEKATITVNDKQAVQKPDLTFEFQLGVKEGEVSVKVNATDEAGNKEEKSFKIRYVRQSQ